MSSLTTAELSTVSTLVDFERGPGYVLNFSDREFSQFFGREFGINIDDPIYATSGTSKGKRLRTFLEKVDNATAAQTLTALWSARAALLADTGKADPVGASEELFRTIMQRVGDIPKVDSSKPPAPSQQPMQVYDSLEAQLTALQPMAPHARGYAFQNFLYGVFEAHGTNPRTSFRNRGEEIDGSFSLAGHAYLIEAKWEAKPTGVAALRAFEGKLMEKVPWVRGLFISYVGFSIDGLAAFGRAKRTLCMDGYDLFEMLNQKLSLEQVLEAKARRAAETGLPFVNVRELF